MRVIIAAAGTGGHINPGIAIANEIKKNEPDSEIIFIGTNNGIERDLIPRAGYTLKTLDAYGLQRKPSIQNLRRMYRTLKSYKKAKEIVKEFKPDIIIGTGGYICGPVISAGLKYNIKTTLHESNAFPGVAVKLLSGKVNTVMLGFEDAKKRLPKAHKIVVTGTPSKVYKINLSENKKNELKQSLDIKNNLPIVLVFGGSQGAESINNSLVEIVNNKLNSNYQLIWSVGQSKYEDIKKQLNNTNNVKLLPYIYNMEEILNLADIVVARSGAMTITEVTRCHKPAIFIPFPYATENHQEYNAKVLANIGAAKIILDKDLKGQILNTNIVEIVQNQNKMNEMGFKAASVEIKNVEEKIYNEIRSIINE